MNCLVMCGMKGREANCEEIESTWVCIEGWPSDSYVKIGLGLLSLADLLTSLCSSSTGKVLVQGESALSTCICSAWPFCSSSSG